MTSPQEPRDPAASSPSDTGWPVDSGEPPPPLEPGDPTEVAGRPSVPETEQAALEPDPESDPEPDPEPEAAQPLPAPEPGPVSVSAAEPLAVVVGAPRRRRLTAPTIALLLTTVVMAIANGFIWYRVQQSNATENARRSGLEASRDAARVLFSYDYRQLDKDFAAGKALTTGAFAKQYAETTAKVVTPVATDKKAVVKAEVVTAGVVRATRTTVVTIVYVNQVTTSSLAQAPKVDLSRVRMTLTTVAGHWRVAKVDAL